MRQPRQTIQTEIGANPEQKIKIALMLRVLGIRREWEQQSMTMAEAGRFIRLMGREIKLRRSVRDASKGRDGRDGGKRLRMDLP
jgi:hypothetical protein